VAILLDTGIVYAYYDRRDSWHKKSVALLQSERGGLILAAPVIPEVDHLLGARLGSKARAVFYEALVEGDYFVADLASDKYRRVAELNRQFAELELGFVDAALIAIGESLGLKRIATSDRRDFEPLAAALGLVLLP
jgi:predicted nucleic acid-binding protein